MSEIQSCIENSKLLTDIFGYWPSFHDAEVIDLHLWRGRVEPENNLYQFPVLTIRFHLWELTKDVNSEGGLIMRHHTLATLRFHDIEEDNEFSRFNCQNQIFELNIECSRQPANTLRFKVEINPSLGLTASFKCSHIEVLECKPCDEEGNAKD